MAKLAFAAKTIEYEGMYGTSPRKYVITLPQIESVSVGTREKKILFGLIKKNEKTITITTKGVHGIDEPIVYAESDDGADEFARVLEKAKQFASDNEIKMLRG